MARIQNAYNDVSALTCYNLRDAYYRLLEIKARSEYGPLIIYNNIYNN